MTKFFLVVLVFSSMTLRINAQIERCGRYEMELTDNEEKYKSIGLGESGVILYRQTVEGTEGHFEMIRLDTALNPVWKEFFIVGRGMQLLRVLHYKESLYFLFKEANLIGSKGIPCSGGREAAAYPFRR